jgi:hypothetical protein
MLNPNVTFTTPGDITVTVQGQNIPDGTPVRLRVTMVGNVKELPHPAYGHPLPSDGRGTAAGEPNVSLSGGTATFTLTVPRGRGTLQAFAEFMVQVSTELRGF